jgi:hypothetical protein
MNKVVRQCEDDLLAAFNAGRDYASRDEAPDFQVWLERRNENRCKTSREAELEAQLSAALDRIQEYRAAAARWAATLGGGEAQ